VDSSWASVTQLMDARESRWSREMLAALDIPPRIMPTIVSPGVVVSQLLEPLVATAIGDLMVQAMGLGVLKTLEEALPIIKRSFPILRHEPHATAEWNDAYARFLRIAGQTQ